MAKRDCENSAGRLSKRQKVSGEPNDSFTQAHAQEQSPLFQISGEIRNEIYDYALDMHLPRIFSWQALGYPEGWTGEDYQWTHPTEPMNATFSPNYSRRQSYQENDGASQPTANFLFTCKQIHKEARSLLEDTTRAIVPLSVIRELHPTSKLALTSFMHITIKFPSMEERSENVYTRFDVDHYGSELRKALCIFRQASSVLCSERGRLRHATIDLGWGLLDSDQAKRSAKTMAKDTCTDWEVRHDARLWRNGGLMHRTVSLAKGFTKFGSGRVKFVMKQNFLNAGRMKELTTQLWEWFKPQSVEKIRLDLSKAKAEWGSESDFGDEDGDGNDFWERYDLLVRC